MSKAIRTSLPTRGRALPDRGRTLVGALDRLSRRLGVFRDYRALRDASGVSDQWDDEEYIYAEVEMEGVEDLEVDLTIQNGRAFLRIAR